MHIGYCVRREAGMSTVDGHILTPRGFVRGRLESVSGRITRVEGDPVATADVRDATTLIVLPGFIDLHVHGAGGRDIMEGGDGAAKITRIHAEHGTTSLLATTMTAPTADLDVAFAGLAGSLSWPYPPPRARGRAPGLTDSEEHLDDLLGRISAAGATSVTVFGLHLRGSTRGWFMDWLARDHPELVGHYRQLYRRGAYLPADYRAMLARRAAGLTVRHGLTGAPRMTAAPARLA